MRRTGWRAARPARLLMLALLLAGCTLGGPESAVPTSYDFGPPPTYARSNPGIAGTVLVAPVRAPAWLDDNGIVFRLLYEDPLRTRSYATSKWGAEPASLMTDRLRSRFAALAQGVVAPGFGAHSDYTLRVELEDFSQQFDAPSQSRALLRARATLLDSEGRKLLAQRFFEVERPAAPNAPGAVKALTEATDVFLENVVKWAAENAKK
jgi:cholesterol transport system auxiliary component